MNINNFNLFMKNFRSCPNCKNEYYQLEQKDNSVKINCNCGFKMEYIEDGKYKSKEIKDKIKEIIKELNS